MTTHAETPATALELVRRNVTEIFNADDDARRRQLIEAFYHSDAGFYDAEGTATGYDEIERTVRGLHERTTGLTFSVAIEPTVVEDLARISWALSPPEGLPVTTGMDLALVRDGRISSLYTFLDPQ